MKVSATCLWNRPAQPGADGRWKAIRLSVGSQPVGLSQTHSHIAEAMIRFPRLMLGGNLPQLISISAEIEDTGARLVEINAADLITAEPVALCILAAALARLERRRQRAIVRNVSPRVKEALERMDVLAPWLREAEDNDRGPPQAPIQARRVSSIKEANAIANALARAIASFVPEEDLAALLEDDPDLRRYRAVEQPVGYVMTELLDNALSHSRAGGFRHSSAWIAAQYYPAGDLMRVCVLDDGCGFLRTLREHPKVVPKTDLVAVEAAFQPFLSCKRDVRVFRDSTHQGIGLTVCRDLCLLAEGSIQAISGRAWVRNPGSGRAVRANLKPGYQGAILNLEFHRRAITPGSVGEILKRYQPDENLPIRFF